VLGACWIGSFGYNFEKNLSMKKHRRKEMQKEGITQKEGFMQKIERVTEGCEGWR
jgi:hypothetical protein